MAINATICRAELNVADMDRGYYATHSLTLAKHPSETDLRFMLRIAVFAKYAHEFLTFGKGLSSDDEPDLWENNLNGTIERWIDLGQPSDKRIRKASGKSAGVVVVNYDERAADTWWQAEQSKLTRFKNLTVLQAGSADALNALATLADRNMHLTATIQDGELWLGGDGDAVNLTFTERS